MRKSPLLLAISLALTSHFLVAETTSSEEEKPPFSDIGNVYDYLDSNELNEMDHAAAMGKRSALTGYLYEEAQLNELRAILRTHENQEEKKTQIRNEFPLKPDEITELRLMYSEIERAQNQPVHGDSSFRIRNITYNPDSNEPLKISVSPGYSAQIEFYDSSGKPWPISEDGVIGDGESFSKQVLGKERHIASFVLKRNYRASNSAIILDSLPASIPLLLEGTDSTVDGRVTVTIPRLGPKADVMPVFSHDIDSVSPELVRLQGGNAPAGARVLKITGVPNSEAWFDGESLFLSLPGRLLLPPALNSSISPAGRYLYKVAPTPFVTVSINGQRLSGTIEGVYQTNIRRARSVYDEDR